MDRVFYYSECEDPNSGLPIYIFDTSYLPSPDLIDYDAFIKTLMTFLPDHKYVLVMFNCGLNKISWVWGIKFLKNFLANDATNIDNLVKVITVHDSWFMKSIAQILTNINKTKRNFVQINQLIESFSIMGLGDTLSQSQSKNQIVNCHTLSDLIDHVDISKLKISLNVYKRNSQLDDEQKIIASYPPLLDATTNINPSSDPVFYHHFYQIFNILDVYGDNVELLFHRPGNKLITDIFHKCVNRNQLIWINDWDLYSIATAFKRFLMDLREPFLPIKLINLPIENNLCYTFQTLKRIFHSYDSQTLHKHVVVQLFDLCHRMIGNSKATKHNSTTLAKCLCHCLSHEQISSQNKDNILIVNRFLKNCLDFWPRLRPLFKERFPTIQESMSEKQEENNRIEESYDLSYDLTVDDNEDEDEDYRVKYNTSNILNENCTLSNSYSGIQSITNKSTNESSRKLADVSNLTFQYPPQKYKFTNSSPPVIQPSTQTSNLSLSDTNSQTSPTKKPVIRGRKVGELARLFEERTQGLELLSSM